MSETVQAEITAFPGEGVESSRAEAPGIPGVTQEEIGRMLGGAAMFVERFGDGETAEGVLVSELEVLTQTATPWTGGERSIRELQDDGKYYVKTSKG